MSIVDKAALDAFRFGFSLPKTNANKFRYMTDEELVAFIANVASCGYITAEKLDVYASGTVQCCSNDELDNIRKWLQQESKECGK